MRYRRRHRESATQCNQGAQENAHSWGGIKDAGAETISPIGSGIAVGIWRMTGRGIWFNTANYLILEGRLACGRESPKGLDTVKPCLQTSRANNEMDRDQRPLVAEPSRLIGVGDSPRSCP
jgi:hypothetical protein